MRTSIANALDRLGMGYLFRHSMLCGKAPGVFNSVHGVHYRVRYEVDSHVGIEHHVVKSSAWPLGVVILAYEQRTFAINGVDHLLGFFLLHLDSSKPTDFLVARAEDKHTERVMPLAKDVRCTTSHNDAMSLLGLLSDHAVRQLDQLISVEDLVVGDG